MRASRGLPLPPRPRLYKKGSFMRALAKYVSLALLGGAFILPASVPVTASEQSHEEHERRERLRQYYDRDHHDYHNWDDRENRAYRHYLEEQRELYRDFSKQNEKARERYWKWRHEHREEVYER